MEVDREGGEKEDWGRNEEGSARTEGAGGANADLKDLESGGRVCCDANIEERVQPPGTK